jgi:hypothetical protein
VVVAWIVLVYGNFYPIAAVVQSLLDELAGEIIWTYLALNAWSKQPIV